MSKIKKYSVPLIALVLVVSIAYFIAARQPYKGSVYVAGSENPYSIFIDVEISKLTVLKGGKVYKSYPCAGGKSATPSPIGTWKIVNKSLWGEGFGGRWLGLNVPWGEYGIHGTIFPESIGRTSSHGCIRMNNRDVAALYKLIPIGTTVMIIDGTYGVWGRGFRTIKPGMRGADIREIQRRLTELNYYHGPLDGIYGKGMITSVHQFQRAYHMTVDDVVHKNMLHKLGFMEWD